MTFLIPVNPYQHRLAPLRSRKPVMLAFKKYAACTYKCKRYQLCMRSISHSKDTKLKFILRVFWSIIRKLAPTIISTYTVQLSKQLCCCCWSYKCVTKGDIIGILLSITIANTSINVYCVHSVTVSHIIWEIHCSMVTQEQNNYFSMSFKVCFPKN